MAKRIVTHTLKDDEGDILFLGNLFDDWSPRSKENIISDIENGVHTYVASSPVASEVDIYVVEGDSGPYLRTDPDTTKKNNLDELPSLLSDMLPGTPPEFLGDYPHDQPNDWSNNLQGVTHSNDHWFFTQLTKLFKFHVSTDLDTNFSSAVKMIHMPQELKDFKCNHFGDPDYFVVDGQGYIFIPVEGDEGDCGGNPRLAVFRDDADLSYVGSAVLPSQNSQNGTPRAGWCAISPLDQLLYSSHNKISAQFPVFRYQVDFASLNQGQVILNPVNSLILHYEGTPVNIPQYIQGGCFSPNGNLFICSGKLGDVESNGGIRVFLPNGELLYHSSVDNMPFLYEYHSGVLGGSEEPEGITYWDLESLPDGLQAPNISGQLHAILLNNELIGESIYFKHYQVQ